MGFVTRFMDADHIYIDQLWVEFLAEKENSIKAAQFFDKFQTHIQKHIHLEDTVLFPRFDVYTGLSDKEGPTVLARRDHEAITKLMAAVKSACEIRNMKEIQRLGEHLQRALFKHRERENKIQYPVLDSFISEDEWSHILERVYGTSDMSVVYTK